MLTVETGPEHTPAFPDYPQFLSRSLPPDTHSDDPDCRLLLYSWMYLARYVDERILELFRQGRMKGTVTGGQGNEGLIVPLALSLDKTLDVVSWTHRDLAGHLIWSDSLGRHLCQYLANAASPTAAREGNVHHGDPARRSYPMISHLGAMVSNVLGGVDSQRRFGHASVGLAFYGDGGSSTGDIHESLNLAALWKLPVLFVVENNGYAYSTPLHEQFHSSDLAGRARGYGIEGYSLDGCNPLEVLTFCQRLLADIRKSPRPVLVEAHTLRLRGHAAYDTCEYIPPELLENWWKRDPLPRFRAELCAEGAEQAIIAREDALRAMAESSFQAALPIPRPHVHCPADTIFAPPTESACNFPSDGPKAAEGKALTMAQALNEAHRFLLRHDSRCLVLGQDIGEYGGAFKVTENLRDEFGRNRVVNTPLAESGTVGYAIGLALNGHRPIVEFQFADFATDATTQITLNAATYFFRSGARVPLVLRMPCGGGLTFGSFHSQDLETLYAHMPGLKILYPSSPQDAFHALLAAYQDDNPVLVFEHKKLYRQVKAPILLTLPDDTIWHPAHLEQGQTATWVAYGEMLLLAREASAYLRDEYDFSFDLFDLRALQPLRLDEILASVARTGRLIVLHEARRFLGFGAEVVSRVVENCFDHLEAPPLRLASADCPVPFAPELEFVYRPSREAIIDAVVTWLESGSVG